MESFFSLVKTERTPNQTRAGDEARADLLEYSERFYNPKRRHSTTGYLDPMEFRTEARISLGRVNETGRRPVLQPCSSRPKIEKFCAVLFFTNHGSLWRAEASNVPSSLGLNLPRHAWFAESPIASTG